MTDLLTPEKINNLRQRAERAEAEADCYAKAIDRWFAFDGGPKAKIREIETAQSTIAELTATVERMRGRSSFMWPTLN